MCEELEGPEFDKPTHRCPECGGTSQVGPSWSVSECPTCTPYGPFGLVPVATAIERNLSDNVGPKEEAIRRAQTRGPDMVKWLLDDVPVGCPRCEGSGAAAEAGGVCRDCKGRGVIR